ncbi:MAG: hypothetical protein HY313_08790 [Acidobacteria bacterium]|nr:hypothetical protein [Acidobacteriota bacterium]
MKRTLFIAPFLLIVQPLPLSAQTPSGYPTKQEVTTMLKDVDYVLRRFEEESDKVNFSRWNAPYALTDAIRKSLDAARDQIRVARSQITEMEASQTISSRLLVSVYLALTNASHQAGQLSLELQLYEAASPLSVTLSETSTAAINVGTAFVTLLYRQLEAQDSEVVLCRLRETYSEPR